jgi:hypothetical protein
MASTSKSKVKPGDETTPLLATQIAEPTTQPNGEPLLHQNNHETPNIHNGEDEDKPLPRTQIFLLCYARLVEPIAFFAIFPFINKMIYETGDMTEADVGFYSGLIVSTTSCLVHRN